MWHGLCAQRADYHVISSRLRIKLSFYKLSNACRERLSSSLSPLALVTFWPRSNKYVDIFKH